MIDKSTFIGEIAINSKIDLQDGELIDILIEQCTDKMFNDLFEEQQAYRDDYNSETPLNVDLNNAIDAALKYLIYAEYKFIRDTTNMPTGDSKNDVQNMSRVLNESGDWAYSKYCRLFNGILNEFKEADGHYKEYNRFGI